MRAFACISLAWLLSLSGFAQDSLPGFDTADVRRSYIRYPVQDATGIGGTWDFTLKFHPAPPPEGGPARGMPKGGPPAGDPSGPVAGPPSDDLVTRITLFYAIKKELGLKLESHKRSVPVLVIDHIERQPAENCRSPYNSPKAESRVLSG